MVMCYFGVDKNGDQVSGSWTGWATGYKVDKVSLDYMIRHKDYMRTRIRTIFFLFKC